MHSWVFITGADSLEGWLELGKSTKYAHDNMGFK